jgi:hypothetical protein
MSFENRYGRLDRLLHRIAFTTLSAQEGLADVEDRLFRREILSADPGRPVFITGLPRSGTTILLNVLSSSGEFATHTYRDMPFVLCPLLWRQFSSRFGVEDRPRERAHGDGLLVSLDSPESFEEVVWKRFWPKHYPDDRIRPWTASESDPFFTEFFGQHMRKVIVARREDPSSHLRYLSKNNVSIARLSTLSDSFPDSQILIPFRDPLQHASSLLLQHRRFLEVHGGDDFARRYAADVGHSEFGLAHRPIDFFDWLPQAPDTRAMEYWLRYWTVAYRHVLDSMTPNARLVSYSELSSQPVEALTQISRWIDVDTEPLTRSAPQLKSPRAHPVEVRQVDPSVLEAAAAIYHQLQEKSAPTAERLPSV